MLYFDHPSSTEHDPGAWHPDHPDSPERIRAIEAALAATDWAGLDRHSAPAATPEELMLVHSPTLIQRIQSLCEAGGGALDDDTYVSGRSFTAALHAAGGACAMVRALVAGEDSSGFSGLRPSGHHADRDRAMGFCLFNNVAVAAELAIRELGLARVMIIDWDVHHGNGTAAIFRRRADVLYASIHQQGLYPGTGSASDAGSDVGYGYTVNLPVQAGSGEEIWLSMLEHLVLPVGERFRPDLILISAGFDAHRLDPLGNCKLEASSFAQMAVQVRDLGERLGVPVGAVLEGGYHATALAESVVATVQALGGAGEPESIAPDAFFTPRAASYVGHHWEL
jgi:acetoin utilization deacetylase AcuC-like enzyme